MKKDVIILITLIILFITDYGCEEKPYKQIKGVVVKVDYIFHEQTWATLSTKKVIVEFADGRIMTFNGVPQDTFQKGRENIIYVDERNYIRKVEIK